MHIQSLLLSTLGLVSITSAFPSQISNPERLFPRLLLQKLDANADEDSLRYQPALDFDKDGCYHTAAIDRDGTVNKGLSVVGDLGKDCRELSRLINSNVYTRKRCNNGWCAYLYDYYFETDRTGLLFGGHRHDWENAVVFVKNNTIRRVVVSAHGEYLHKDKPLTQDGHPLIVYHKCGVLTHALRFAKDKDVRKVENHYGKWVMADLVGWDGFPTPEHRKKLSSYKFGKANFHLTDERFASSLKRAAGTYVDGFDCMKDGGEEYKKKDERGNKDMRKEKQKEKVKDKSKIKVKEKD
ncbi:NLP4 [Fusarium sp. NRRL 52700]|nr:NLP4 [Fusarium sp. NRRL 52700]